MHLQRAKELMPALENRAGLSAQPVLAEHLVATGRPEQALDLLSRTTGAQFADTRDADEMLVCGARVTADLMEAARDRRDREAVRKTRAAFDDLLTVRRSMLPAPFEVGGPEDLIQPAMEALFTAETARSMAETPTSAVWEEAVRRCDAAGLRWDEAVASWRWAQALLAEGATRAAVAVPLRSAHRFAVEQARSPCGARCTRWLYRQDPARRAVGAVERSAPGALPFADEAGAGGALPSRGKPDLRRDREGAVHQ